ncbi:MAG: hypothetical protein R2762_14415 [Bryobacteraceae bacterium]
MQFDDHRRRRVVAWVLVATALAVVCAPALGQISPGPMSAPHQSLEGATKCTTCHTLAVGAPRFKCLGCHGEIAARLRANRGFHARVVKIRSNEGSREQCVKCHTEHFGRQFYIIKWKTSAEEFDHREAGYTLQGKHARLACNRCHKPANISPEDRKLIRTRDPNRTYLGVSPACKTCHDDVHRGQFTAECSTCHINFDAWKPVAGFDHGKARFLLTGLHQRVACAHCHKAAPGADTLDAKPTIQFRGIAFSSCRDCHKDPHNGAFPGACESCHTTDGWKRVRMSSTFDHSKTPFPLAGKHSRVECFECHRSVNFKEPVAHERCADCHRKDPHRGQFQNQDCASCHNEQDFKPSLFDLSRHQKSTYPLEGKHTAVECAKCHTPAGAETQYRIAHGVCADCHRDAHGGQFASRADGGKCESCHNEHGFKPSSYTMREHRQTRFALEGGHAATVCSDCHKPDAGTFPAPPARFRFPDLDCTGCHADPHTGPSSVATKVTGNKADCKSCHTTRSWKQTSPFDHDRTGFTLSGAHRAVACSACHKVEGLGVARVVFAGAPRVCAGCHRDIHGGQFSRARAEEPRSSAAPSKAEARRGALRENTPAAGAADCQACHGLLAWKPTQFDHETNARFSLAGAHREVACSKCHVEREEIRGESVVIYSRTPSTCAACHADKQTAGLRGQVIATRYAGNRRLTLY